MAENTYAPIGYAYDAKGNLIPEHMEGKGLLFAPVGYKYNRQGNLTKLEGGAMKVNVHVFRDCDGCGKPVQESDETLCPVCKAIIRARIAIDSAKSFKHKFWKLEVQ